jgi:hypothetical protein
MSVAAQAETLPYKRGELVAFVTAKTAAYVGAASQSYESAYLVEIVSITRDGSAVTAYRTAPGSPTLKVKNMARAPRIGRLSTPERIEAARVLFAQDGAQFRPFTVDTLREAINDLIPQPEQPEQPERYAVEPAPSRGYYVADNVERCLFAGPFPTREQAEQAVPRHISDDVRAELAAAGFTLNAGTWSRLVANVEEAGQLGDGARVVNLRICDAGRWFEAVDGWGVVIKDCDLRDYANNPRGAIRHLVPSLYADPCRLLRQCVRHEYAETAGRPLTIIRRFANLGQLQPVTMTISDGRIEMRIEGVDGRGSPCHWRLQLPAQKARAKALLADLERHQAAGTRGPAAAAWEAHKAAESTRDNRPMAAPGLTSYRCKSAYSGWIMIGARDAADALREARRSRSDARAADLQIWDATADSYVAC